jgi:hypothetical protein
LPQKRWLFFNHALAYDWEYLVGAIPATTVCTHRNAKMCLPFEPSRPTCSITVQGPLNDSWADYLGELCQEVIVEDGRIISTTLTGQPIDLLAFIGMLTAIANWSLTLIAAHYQLTAPHGGGAGNDDKREVPAACGDE